MEFLRDKHSTQAWGSMQSAWPCLATGKMQHLLTMDCCCGQSRDETISTLLYGVASRMLTDTENHPRGVFYKAKVEERELFDVATALSAMAEEGVSEVLEFLTENSMDNEHT